MIAQLTQILTQYGPDPFDIAWQGLLNGSCERLAATGKGPLIGTAQHEERHHDSPAASKGLGCEHAESSLIGSRVGSYQISEKLGAGGFGNVFKGVDMMLQRQIALKLLRSELTSDASFVERFRREARTLAKLNHPNIANVYALLERGDAMFMVMEYVPGKSLHHVIRAQGALPLQQALQIFQQALQGIGYAHRCGVVHRDIKPANIMLTEDNRVKILDFGIAHVLGTGHLTLTGQIGGTVAYMSPEQIRGEEMDARTDIYSLGVLLYILLTGHPPFTGKSAYELMKSQVECPPPPLCALTAGVPAHLEAAVMRALQKRPSDRFQSTEEFSQALGQDVIETLACHAEGESDAAPQRTDQTTPPTSATRETPLAIAGEPQANNATTTDEKTVSASAPLSAAQPDGPVPKQPRNTPAVLVNWFQARCDRGVLAVVLGVLPVVIFGLATLPRIVQDEAPAAASLRTAAAVSTDLAPSQLATGRLGTGQTVPPPIALSQPTAPAPLVVKDESRPTFEKTPALATLAIVHLRAGRDEAARAGAASGETLQGANDASSTKFKRGELIDLLIKPSHDAYVYCYLQDETQKIRRFYPNRFSPRALIRASAPLQIPGKMRFQLVANELGVKETVACFATERNVMTELPSVVTGKDFQALPISSLEQVRSAFTKVGGQTLVQGYFHVEVR